VEMTGIEPVVAEAGRFTVSCHTITAASPLFGTDGQFRNVGLSLIKRMLFL
jgi:hypothetical protein